MSEPNTLTVTSIFGKVLTFERQDDGDLSVRLVDEVFSKHAEMDAILFLTEIYQLRDFLNAQYPITAPQPADTGLARV